MTDDSTRTTFDLHWGVKASFRSYTESVGGTETLVSPATVDESRILFPGMESRPLSFAGQVRFVAHGGMLDITIADPSLEKDENGYLLAVANHAGERTRIARLVDIASEVETWTASPELTQAGAEYFGSFYPTGSRLDPLEIRSTGPALSVAIVGSGPSGCYTAQALRKEWPTADITIFDRLPVPYGLVRYGVATDHQGTKAVTRQFARLFEREGVRFAGNIDVGREVSLDDLRTQFDVVVLATGASADRRLSIGPDVQNGIYYAGPVSRYLNDHPGEEGFTPRFGRRVLIVGGGNVAIDLARVLAKSPDQFGGSDLHPDVAQNLESHPVEQIHLVARSRAESAKFDPVMVRELADIPGLTVELVDTELGGDDNDPHLAVLRDIATRAEDHAARVRLSLSFGWSPASLTEVGDDLTAVFMRGDETLTVTADSVISAIGFVGDHGDDTVADGQGNPPAGLYSVGWRRHGAVGAMPEVRRDARRVVTDIVATTRSNTRNSFPIALVGSTSFDDWRRIDEREQSAAPPGRVRQKLRTFEKLLSVARSTS